MPKDPTENIARYKIRGGHMNEYEFQHNQEALAESPEQSKPLIPGTPPELRAKQLKELTQRVAAATRSKTTKEESAVSKKTTTKSAPRLAAKRRSAKSAPKSAAKKRTTKSTPKSAAKKTTARKRTRK